MKNQQSVTKSILITLCFLASNLLLQAQTIDFNFPRFAGRSYTYLFVQGDRKDTVAVGQLDLYGKATITIPPKYKGYAGISQWILNDGGRMELIVNGESFKVSSAEAIPNQDNIVYSGSAENDFFIRQYKRQQVLFPKIDAMGMAIRAYTPSDPLYPVFEKELKNVITMFESLQVETAQSPLYAARYRQITDFLMGIGDNLYDSESERAKALGAFAANKLDIDALYTSNQWGVFLESWMDMQLNAVQNDSILVSDTKMMLSRIRSDEVYTAFAEKIVSLWNIYGKDPQLEEIGIVLKNSGRLKNPSTYLKRLGAGQKGDTASALAGLTGNNSFIGTPTLLVFHESGCGNCEPQIEQLIANYSLLQKNGVRLITISADSNKMIFEGSTSSLPWADKLCDYEGIEGENFKNYGVIGTPTFIVIDKKGKIAGRYAKLEDTKLLASE